MQVRANLEAAAISLKIVAEKGAAKLTLAIDGEEAPEVAPGAEQLVRRHAKIAIAGWGRIEIARGSDSRSVDQIEDELGVLDRQFADLVASFGVYARDASALDQLRSRAAEKKIRDGEIDKKQIEFSQMAPNGLEPLQNELASLRARHANQTTPAETSPGLPAELDKLDQLAQQLKKEIGSSEADVDSLRKRDRSGQV